MGMDAAKEKENVSEKEQENEHENQRGSARRRRSGGNAAFKNKRPPTPAHWFEKAKTPTARGDIPAEGFGDAIERAVRPLSGNWI